MILEKKKLTAELLRVRAAKAEMDYIIEQRMEEIGRLKAAIDKQEETEKTLTLKLEQLEKN